VTTTTILYILASPILLIKAIGTIRKQVAAIERIRDGTITCSWCEEAIHLNRIARCANCSAVTPGSLLRCSHCRTTFTTVTCDACNSTVKVL